MPPAAVTEHPLLKSQRCSFDPLLVTKSPEDLCCLDIDTCNRQPQGLWPNYIKVVPSIALAFTTYELLKEMMGALLNTPHVVRIVVIVWQ